MSPIPDHGTPTQTREPIGPSEVDELARLSMRELGDLYERAEPPESLEALAGSPSGRMLAALGPFDHPSLRERVARLSGASWFPWLGKSFEAFDEERGAGINRVRLLGDKYRFDVRYDRSAIDDEPCVVLDYGRPDNPFFIRAIHDELRELRPGLFLGPAMLKTKRGPRLLLWFSIDARLVD